MDLHLSIQSYNNSAMSLRAARSLHLYFVLHYASWWLACLSVAILAVRLIEIDRGKDWSQVLDPHSYSDIQDHSKGN